MTKLVFQIPNALYLPNSEALPTLSRYVSEIAEAPGVDWIINCGAFEYTSQVATIYLVETLIEILEEGVLQETEASDFSEEPLCEIDASVYSWLKQAESYRRLGLQENDESNPSLEVFVFTSDYD